MYPSWACERVAVGRGLRYFRLHGRPAYHYRYRHIDAVLSALEAMLSRAWPNRVLLNNIAMTDEAKRFMQLLNS